MYQTGSKVVYGIHGVCVVAATEEKSVDGKQVTYLVLEPLAQPGARYLVPTHNEIAMSKVKPMLHREELEALLQSEEIRQGTWIREDSQRKQIYRELISSGDRSRLLAMVYTLYRHRDAQQSSGRKMHLCDENFLRDAERLLTGEVSVVLEMTTEAARAYVRTRLEK